MKILLADDEDVSRLLIRRNLEKLGHEIVECSDGDAVGARLDAGDCPPLLLVDWMMPGTTGLDLCKRIRSSGSLEARYIILMSSRTGRDDILAGLRAGANDYLMKPVRLEELEGRIAIATRILDLQAQLANHRSSLVAASRMMAVGQMAAGMAHEINNPLAVISANIASLVDALEEVDVDRDAMRASLFKMDAHVMRVAKIVGSLKTFAQEDGKAAPRILPARAIVDAALALCRERFLARGVAIEIDADTDAAVEVHKSRVVQALLNLLENALQATESDAQGRGRTRVGVGSREGQVVLSVEDNGPGVPPEIRERIFIPFFTTRDVGRGIGLGLPVAKGIAENYGGHVDLADGTPGRTRFEMTFPSKSRGA